MNRIIGIDLILQSLASLEERINPGELESDKDRLLLIQEKEQLLRELRSISPRNRPLQEMERVRSQCERLEYDLNAALETSNVLISDRLKVHETKQMLLQQLTEAMRAMTQLESQLKTLSASTLSMSSSSSLGSLSSSHASSKGSLSSLSFTDIYGLSTTVASNETSASDLKRVLQQPQLQPQRSTVHPGAQDHFLSSSQQSLSPHSSLTSLSPPVTPMESGYSRPPPLRLSTIDESSSHGLEYLLQKNRSNDSGAPLSPLEPQGLTASSESVAGDSGVFEATSPTKNLPPSDAEKLTSLMAAMSFDSAQVQIKFKYDREDSLLQIGIERARNLRTLILKPNRQLYLKVSLVPSVSPSNWSFTTQPVQADASNETPVIINETFPVAVPKSKLSTKTLQVTIWTASEDTVCVGSTQISLADFDWDSVSMRWYNILSLQFTMLAPQPKKANGLFSQGQTLTKEESSDDSTIISSQGSTLTRRNMDVMSLQVFEDLDEADIVIPSEPAFETVTSCAHKAFMKPKKAIMDSKETNTECVFVKPPTSGGGQSGARPKVKDLVKRSKTFNYNSKANEVEGKANYNSNVKLNRSDSDGAMPLYRKLPFQHNLNERRSLRLPTKFNILPNDHHKIISGGKKSSENQALEVTKLQLKRSRRLARTKEHVMETPLDLELDLAAQKTKLELLQSDIARLREIQCKLEEAKSQHSGGGTQMDSWLVDHEYDEYLQNLLSKVINGKIRHNFSVKMKGGNVNNIFFRLSKIRQNERNSSLCSWNVNKLSRIL